MLQQASAIAPASIANVAVGFDLLGQAFAGCHDKVTAHRSEIAGVRLGAVTGLMSSLPTKVTDNTALRGASALLQAQGSPFGVVLDIEKGIPKSAGLGGSAASSVAAVLAVNAILDQPLSTEQLFDFVLEGERASSDPPPADNVAACLFGGLVLLVPDHSGEVVQLPAPDGISSIVFHPDLQIETAASRKALSDTVSLAKAIDFAAHIASFTAACYRSDITLLRKVMRDILIEPQRAASIPCFYQVQQAAMQAGVICCSISGSGPSIFAWVETENLQSVQAKMRQAFQEANIKVTSYHSPLNAKAAMVEQVL
ncbi:MAG: homoserine kinase [Robiginitomaculum sp.]|nr:homoserine kinase [Robiginitomaculum sp.]